MKQIKQFVDGLNALSGTNEKILYLEQYKNDEHIAQFLTYMFSPFSLSNLSTKKLNKKVSVKPDVELLTFSECLDYAFNTSTGKDIDIANIRKYIEYNLEHEDFIIKCISKQLTLGVSAKSINKAFGDNFIPEMHVQLAHNYFENEEHVKNKQFALTLKLDGIRCVAIKMFGRVNLLARSGKPIEDADEIVEELEKCAFDNFVIDGELLVSNWRKIDSKSAYKATSKIVKAKGKKTGLSLVAFDFVLGHEWNSQKCTEVWGARMQRLSFVVANSKHIELVPILYKGDNINKINEILNVVKKDKQEGLMLNVMHAVYQFKRTKDLLKVKVMQDCDLLVVGVCRGKGRLSDSLGALVVEYKGNKINVGAGFTDSMREKIWKKQDKIIGRVIKVQYFEETEDANGNKSLRFPVFIEVCEKGKEPSLH